MAKSSIIGKGPLSVNLPSGGGADTPEQVRDKLASLSGSNKLEAESVYYDDSLSNLGAGVDTTQEAIAAMDAVIDQLEDNLADKTYTTEVVTLSTFDISQKFITLQNTPTIAGLTTVTVGGISQQFGVDFITSGTQLSWSTLGLDGLLEAGDIMRIVYN